MKNLKRIGLAILICSVLAACTSGGTGNATVTQNTSVTIGMPGGTELIKDYPNFEVKSESIKNGAWNKVISNTDKGSNKSPQLSWEPVEGADSYMIYMVDTSVEYWMHWKSENVKECNLPEGWAPETEYIGPYPPAGGSHNYEIYVIAVKKPVERMKGGFNSSNGKFASFITALDTDAEGNEGNIISCGHISATFTN